MSSETAKQKLYPVTCNLYPVLHIMQILFAWQWYKTERQSCHFSWIQMQADWSCWNMVL